MEGKRNQPCPCGSGKRYKKCCSPVEKNSAISEVKSAENTHGSHTAADCFRLGTAAAVQGRMEEAVGYFRQALTIQPDYPEVLNNLGIIYQSQGNLEEAADCFSRLVQIDPVSPLAHCNLGVVQKSQGFFVDAVASFRRALVARPDFAEAHYNLGVALEDQGHEDQAEASYKEALVHKPGYVNALTRLGNLRKQQGRLGEAGDYYLQALTAKPSDMTHFNLARIRLEQGRLDEARESYRQALAVRPDYGEAHRCLASLIKYEAETDRHLLAMQDLLKLDDLPDSERMHLAFALGKAYEDLAEYEESFTCYKEGNRLKRATFTYSTDDTVALVNQIKQVFGHALPFQPKEVDTDDPTPIFILGMPRSGTTLVEQILASHPKVYGAGELIDLEQTILQVTGTEQSHEAFAKLAQDKGQLLARIGEGYRRRLRERGPGARFITDKLPSNFLLIGVIHLALPEAKVVHCHRDPMDNCFSIYKNFFAGDLWYAYDLTELGEYYRLYRGLMQFWHRLYPGSIFDLSYERLIDHQEEESRRLLSYCDLTWHQECLAFHRTERPVATASAVQVRRPLYRDSVALWQKFARQLEPLQAVLEEGDRSTTATQVTAALTAVSRIKI